MKWLVVLLAAAVPFVSYASCPSGYHQEDKYCVANSGSSKPATALYGNSCPSGWHRESNFCVANTNNAKQIVPLVGNSCPSGWHRQGQYCISNR